METKQVDTTCATNTEDYHMDSTRDGGSFLCPDICTRKDDKDLETHTMEY